MVTEYDRDWQNPFSIHLTTRIEFGWDASAEVASLISNWGKRCLLFTEEHMLRIPPVKKIPQLIRQAGCEVEVYTDIGAEATSSSIDRAFQAIGAEKADFIVAVGGGSVMDFAKGYSVLAANQRKIWDYVGFTGKTALPIIEDPVPVLTIPTTAGTGSEVTPYAVIVNKDLQSKATIISPKIRPRAAIIDPGLTISLPPHITAYTGADALAQCIESYLNLPARTPYTSLICLEGIQSAASSLVTSVLSPQNKQARSQMAWSSLLGGVAISMAGTGIGHAIAEVLGGLTHLAHGKTVAVMLPAVLRLLEEDHQLDLPQLKQALGDTSVLAYGSVEKIWQEAGLPLKLQDLGLDESYLPLIRHNTLTHAQWAMNANPIPLSDSDVERILAYLW